MLLVASASAMMFFLAPRRSDDSLSAAIDVLLSSPFSMLSVPPPTPLGVPVAAHEMKQHKEDKLPGKRSVELTGKPHSSCDRSSTIVTCAK